MAAEYGATPKTFARRVRADKIPHELFGRSMKFDPVAVSAYLAALAMVEVSNVVRFPVRKTKSTKSRFAEAVGL